VFVLDEADEMLDRGFGPDVERIIGFMPQRRRQNALSSATVPEWVQTVARRLLHEPVEVRVDTGRPASAAPESVEQVVYDVPAGAKPSVLRALLSEDAGNKTRTAPGEDRSATLVFGRTRHGVKKLAKQLEREGYRVGALQSDLAQNARDRVIAQFRSGEIPILVATNVAARGLDIAELDRVINFDLPENGALFTHRVGRTGRMGRAGEAITLLAPEDQSKWRQLEKELRAAGLKQAFPRRPWTGPLPEVPKAPAGTPEDRPERSFRSQQSRTGGRTGAPARTHTSAGNSGSTGSAGSPRGDAGSGYGERGATGGHASGAGPRPGGRPWFGGRRDQRDQRSGAAAGSSGRPATATTAR